MLKLSLILYTFSITGLVASLFLIGKNIEKLLYKWNDKIKIFEKENSKKVGDSRREVKFLQK